MQLDKLELVTVLWFCSCFISSLCCYKILCKQTIVFSALNKVRKFHSKSSNQQLSKRDTRKYQEGAAGWGWQWSRQEGRMQPHSAGGQGTAESSDSSQGHPAGPLHKDNKAGPGWVTQLGAGTRMQCYLQDSSSQRDFIQNMIQLLGKAGTVSHGAPHSSCSAALLLATWEHNCAVSELSWAQMDKPWGEGMDGWKEVAESGSALEVNSEGQCLSTCCASA